MNIASLSDFQTVNPMDKLKLKQPRKDMVTSIDIHKGIFLNTPRNNGKFSSLLSIKLFNNVTVSKRV